MTRRWSSETRDHGVGELGRRRAATEVARDCLPVTNGALEGATDPLRSLRLADVFQHHTCGEYERAGIRDVLTGNVRCRPVDGLEDRTCLPDVGARRETEPPDESGNF